MGRCLAFLLIILLLGACAPRVETPGPAQQSPVAEEDAFIMADGYRLPVQSVLPQADPEAVLIALHGFNDYANAFAKQSVSWAKAGIAVYAYDQRGFGRTEGRGLWHGADTMAQDLIAVTGLLRAQHPDIPIAVLGESMGGAVAINAATNPDLPGLKADRVILSAPAVWGRAVMPWWQHWPLEAFAHLLPWLEVAPRVRRRPSDNIEMLRALSRDPNIIRRTRIDAVYGLVNLMDRAYLGIPSLGEDVLILYGMNEDILPERALKGVVSRLQQGAGWRIAFYDTGFHMLTRDLNANIVIEDIAAFVKDPNQALPSGRGSKAN